MVRSAANPSSSDFTSRVKLLRHVEQTSDGIIIIRWVLPSLGSSQSPVELLSGTALPARLGESQARPLLRLSAATCGDPTGLRIQGLFRCDRELPALAEQVVERFAEQRLARPSFLSRDDPQLAADRFGKVCGNGDDAGAARPGG